MATAVDRMVRPGPLRDELNAGLRRAALFRLPVERATIVIEEGPYAGVEVTVDKAAGSLVRSQLRGLLSPDAAPTSGRDLFDLLETRVILGWNVADHKGKPIRPTARGFALVPPDLIATVIGLYLAMTQPDEPETGAPVPAPVGPPSTGSAAAAVRPPGEVPTFGPQAPTP